MSKKEKKEKKEKRGGRTPYRVRVTEIHAVDYDICADTEDEAIRKALLRAAYDKDLKNGDCLSRREAETIENWE